MAIKLASLFIELAANGDKLTAELKKSSKQTKTWQKNVDVSTKAVARSFKVVAAGAALGTTALTALYISNARSLDTLGKTAAKLGDTTEDLKVFGVAAQLGGVGVDQANTALQRMTRRLAEAAQGSGEAQGAIAELGLDAEALAAQRPSQAFEEIAAALDTVPLAADRVRLAMKFFDSEGVALVNVTTGALNEARQAVNAFGGALTTVEIAQIEAANDSVTTLGVGFDLLTDKFTARVAPAVRSVAQTLFESAEQSQQLEVAINLFADTTVSAIGNIAVTAGEVVKFIDDRPELATGGIVGYLMGGKLGFAAGAAAGSTFDSFSASFDYYKSKFDDTLTDADRAEIALRKVVERMRLLQTPYLGALVVGREDELEDLEKQRRAVVGILSDMGEYDRITNVSFSNADSVAGTFGNTLISIGEGLQNINTETAKLVLSPPKVPNIDLTGGGGSPDDPDEGDGDENKNAVREKFIEDALASEKLFQDTWTFFQEAGAKNRFKILAAENAGALETLAQHSRTMFELNKAVGLANATIYIAEGISASWKLGWPAGAAAAATVALNGAAQIKAITSAKFGSAEVVSPAASATTDVSSANSALAANDDSVTDSVAQSDSNNIVFFGFHTPGATDEQKADEQARLLQIAQDNDLLVRNSDGGFDYTGTGSSNYVSPEFEAVG